MAQIDPQETALSLNDSPREIERIQEFNTDAAMMRVVKEVEGAIIVAQKFKRNEDQAYQAIMKACKRTSFADRAEFSYPRGKKQDEDGKWVDNIISGPSVYLSREMIRLWGNVQVYTEIVNDTDDLRTIRSVAWDVQTNTRRAAESSFRKLIQRRKQVPDPQKPGKMKPSWPPITEWVRPDERDLRELHNKHAAIAERNVSFAILPEDFIYDARMQARLTAASEIQQDPEAARKKLILGFDELNVPVAELDAFLGHPIAQCSPAELIQLRGIWAAIRDGNTTWQEIKEAAQAAEEGETIGEDKANEFFKAYKASGYTVEDASKFLLDTWKIKDSRKIPAADFDKAMAWAKQPKNGAPAADKGKDGQVIQGNAAAPPAGESAQNVTPAEQKPAQQQELIQQDQPAPTTDGDQDRRFKQLIGIYGWSAQKVEASLKQFAGDRAKLVDWMESNLKD